MNVVTSCCWNNFLAGQRLFASSSFLLAKLLWIEDLVFFVISYVSELVTQLLCVRQVVTSSRHRGAAGHGRTVWAWEADKLALGPGAACSVQWAQMITLAS